MPSKPRSIFSKLKLVVPIACYLVIAIVLGIVIKLSLFQGSYNNDPHHWGLMLSNALDLTKGLAPYRDVFLQYGILTSLIQASALLLFGKTLQSIILITAVFYAIGLLGIYCLTLELTKSRKLALYSFLTCALLHEIVIYPWSNYVAYPFLVFGLLFLIKSETYKWNSFISGFLLSLAILCREGLFMPVIALALVVSVLGLHRLGINKFLRINYVKFWLGLTAPIVVFFLILEIYSLLPYWYIDSILLPQAYMRRFIGNGVWDSAHQLIRYFEHGYKTQDIRLIFLSLSISTAIGVCIAVGLGIGKLRSRWDCFLVGIFSLLLISSSFHLNELFRLATGAALGIPLVYLVFQRYKLSDVIFFIFAVFAGSTFIFHPGNNWYPSIDHMYSAVTSNKLPVFVKQRWPQKTFDFYSNVYDDLNRIQAKNCAVDFYVNDTQDAFLATISPFKLYQIAPFGRNFDGDATTQFDGLRLDFDIQAKLAKKDLIILTQLKKGESFQIPEGYLISSHYDFPESYFMPSGNQLLIVIPKKCR